MGQFKRTQFWFSRNIFVIIFNAFRKSRLVYKLNSKIALSVLILAIVFAIYGHVFPNYGSLFRYLYIFNFILFSFGIGCWLQFLKSRFVVFSRFISSDENRIKVYLVTCFGCILFLGFVRDFLVIRFVLNGSDVLVYANLLLMLAVLQNMVLNPSISILKGLTVERDHDFVICYMFFTGSLALISVYFASNAWGEFSPNLSQMLVILVVSMFGLGAIADLVTQRRHDFLIFGLACYPLAFGVILWSDSELGLEQMLFQFVVGSIGALLIYYWGSSLALSSVRILLGKIFSKNTAFNDGFFRALQSYVNKVLIQVSPIVFLVICWEIGKIVFPEPTFIIILGMKVCFSFLSVTRALQVIESLDYRFLVLIARMFKSKVFVYSFVIAIFALMVGQFPSDQMMQEVFFVIASFLAAVFLASFIEKINIVKVRCNLLIFVEAMLADPHCMEQLESHNRLHFRGLDDICFAKTFHIKSKNNRDIVI